jgi:hypothetical protein
MKRVSQLIREIVPVIIGILIALVINNWNEERKDKKYLNQVYSTIAAELEESSRDIENTLPKQQILIDSLNKYMNDETTSIFEIINKAEGIQGPNVKLHAWKAVVNSKVELIEFEKLSSLSEIEESKKYLELKLQKILDFVIENGKETNQEKKEIFMFLNQDIISGEKYLQYEIKEFLNQ